MRFIKIFFILGLGWYGIWGAFHPRAFWIIDGLNLALHESGHLFFGLLQNEFIQFLGGTLAQLMFPLLFWWHFFSREEYYSSTVMIWWFGENFFHIAPYIQDARAQALPLVGGGIHDWGTILGQLGWLQYDRHIGTTAWIMGIIIIIGATGAGLWYAVREQQKEENNGLI